MYKLESFLVDDFLKLLPNFPFSNKKISFSTEFNYSRGRTDIILLTEDNIILAFEAKLHKWRYALDQAYRNTCFAQYSYVLLPEETSLTAVKYINLFKQRSVGLCYISNGKINIPIKSKYSEPLQNWLNTKAVEIINQEGTNV